MLNKFNKNPNFSGHNVYVGLDVHKVSWAVNIIVDDIEHRHFTQPPNALALYNYLSETFPGANYFSAYECGFCGYHHHRELIKLGIQNIVFNPADLPITDKEKTNKRDPLDSRRISHALQKNQLKGIYVFQPFHEQFRSLNRMRWRAAKENRRVKNRIRSFLHYYGIVPPESLKPDYWSLAFINWLKQLKLPTDAGTLALEYLLIAYQNTRSQLLKVTRDLRHQVKLHYYDIYKCLLSVPSIGPVNAMCLISEIGDISRFKSYRQLASFVGLVPRSHQSGNKDPKGSLTYRNNKYILSALIESSWVALRNDPALLMYYKDRIVNHKSQVVITKIAHKLLNRIRFVWMNKSNYQFGLL
jgi:transposase